MNISILLRFQIWKHRKDIVNMNLDILYTHISSWYLDFDTIFFVNRHWNDCLWITITYELRFHQFCCFKMFPCLLLNIQILHCLWFMCYHRHTNIFIQTGAKHSRLRKRFNINLCITALGFPRPIISNHVNQRRIWCHSNSDIKFHVENFHKSLFYVKLNLYFHNLTRSITGGFKKHS